MTGSKSCDIVKALAAKRRTDVLEVLKEWDCNADARGVYTKFSMHENMACREFMRLGQKLFLSA